eukprot:10530183-Heterocapsa_arctica.AAC.1
MFSRWLSSTAWVLHPGEHWLCPCPWRKARICHRCVLAGRLIALRGPWDAPSASLPLPSLSC